MSVKLNILKNADIERIFEAALYVIDHTGTIIEESTAVELLRKAGARVNGSNHVHIPSSLVREAISSAPSEITIYDRLGNEAMVLGSGRSYFETQISCKQITDPDTGKRRETTLEDVARAVRVIDALPNIDCLANTDVVSGVVPEYADAALFATAVANTAKPIQCNLSGEVGQIILEIASAAVGGCDTLRKYPFIISGDSPISPLYHPEEPVQRIMFVAKEGIPCIYNPMPQGGATAPTTMAGVLVMTLSEILTGLVITQLVNPGAPFICGGVPSIFDMRDTTFVYGSPELFLMCSALGDIVHHYNLPSFGTAGMTNSKRLDLQAATDCSLSILMSILSHNDYVHDVGLIDIGAESSLPMTVLVDEIIGMARHIEPGIEVTDETLAVDLIDKVGPRNNFMCEEHTLKHYKKCWYPNLFDHSVSKQDRSQSPTIEERIQQRIENLLASNVPAELPAEAKELINSFAKKYWQPQQYQ